MEWVGWQDFENRLTAIYIPTVFTQTHTHAHAHDAGLQLVLGCLYKHSRSWILRSALSHRLKPEATPAWTSLLTETRVKMQPLSILSLAKFKHQSAAPLQIILSGDSGSRGNKWTLRPAEILDESKKKKSWRSKLGSSCNSSIRSLQIKSFPVSLFPATPPKHPLTAPPPPTRSAPILLVSLDMLPSPLPTLFSAPLHFGHSYIYGAIRCGSPSGASRITAHSEQEGGHGCRQGSGKRGG